ncbi:MAG: hydantoinase/oxoprolinase family protein [Gammaproteobacteria bacterium]|nr:hydantoinase/oxoprolinase family protein [Gammaproteobacteria bacterium]MBI5618154.1 hydantoinase/oxoprolinase family protein [Gammaproteobacteria bacterium]
MNHSSIMIAIDAGGTMTDAYLTDEHGNFAVGKALTNRAAEHESYLEAVDDAAKVWGLDGATVHQRSILSVYTGTAMLNAMLMHKGKRVGMLVTRGFEHSTIQERGLTYLGQSYHEILHQRLHEHTPPLMDPRHVRGITERIESGSYYGLSPAGGVLVPLNEADVRRETAFLLDEGVEAIGIVFLFSYLNPAHERRAAEIAREVIAAQGRDIRVITSADLIPVIKENQRLKSVLIEAYTADEARKQLGAVECAARDAGYKSRLLTVTSYGSVVSIDTPRLYETIISGPVGGLMGGKRIADLKGLDSVVCCDMGGTSFDVGLIVGGGIGIVHEPDFAGHRLALPMVALDSIGAGAGSVIHVDPVTKNIELGPDSAGARVGVCYKHPEITVSDLDVALGYLNPDYFLGGKITLDRERALSILEERLAKPLGQDLFVAAEGVLEVMHTRMKELVYSMLLARGYEPSSYTLFMYGGGGPLHLWGVTEGIPLAGVATFPWAAAFSAFGATAAEYSHRYQAGASLVIPLKPNAEERANAAGHFNRVFADLETQAYRELAAEGFGREQVRFSYGMQARYLGLLESLGVSLPMGRIDDAGDLERAIQAFEDQYEKVYARGAKYREAGYFISEFFVEAFAEKPKPALPVQPLAAPEPAAAAYKTRRKVFHRRRWIDFEILEMAHLKPGNRVPGPAIIEDPMTTLVIPPGKAVEFDAHGLIWYRDAAATGERT